MTLPSFLKKKTTYVILALIVAGAFWYSRQSAKPATTYETVKVVRADLQQTVEVTGEIKPAERIDLAFDRSGTINTVKTKVGDVVKIGDVLAELKNDDVVFAQRTAAAQLAVAQANLNQRLAGETSQAIRIAETNVAKAQASYDKAVSDLASTKLNVLDSLRSAQLAVDTAKNKRDNQLASLTQNLANAIDSERITLLTALGPLQSALSDGDQIAGVDDTATNAAYRSQLGIYDNSSMDRARLSYLAAKPVKLEAETRVRALTASSTQLMISAASDKLLKANILIQTFLGDVQKVLGASITGPSLSAADLAAKKAMIDGDRASISAQNAAILGSIQAVSTTQLSNADMTQQLEDAYQSALVALNTAQTNSVTDARTAQSNVDIQAAALESAKADLDLKKAKPREADLAPLRAAVSQATVTFDKANNDLKKVQITAPVDGTVSEVLLDVGEQVGANAPVVRMVGTEHYDIEALVPEADISKVQPGQSTVITLDAYGDEVKFQGVVTAKDPAETKVQDAIYYKIRDQIDPAGREVKPGMTSNLTVLTGEAKQTIVIPLRAVRTRPEDNAKTVRVLVNGAPQERTIELGLRGDEGRVEVLKGLNEGDEVIVSETGA